jgi:hypothetical protein
MRPKANDGHCKIGDQPYEGQEPAAQGKIVGFIQTINTENEKRLGLDETLTIFA